MNRSTSLTCRLLAALLVSASLATAADAQNSSLLHASAEPRIAQPQSGYRTGRSRGFGPSQRISQRPARLPVGVPSAVGAPQPRGRTARHLAQRPRPTTPPRQNTPPRRGEPGFGGPHLGGPRLGAAEPADPEPTNPALGAPRSPSPPAALSLNDVSWTYRPAPAMRTFEKNDIVTIRVDEISQMMAEGESETRKRTAFEAVLSDWIRLTKGRLRPDAQSQGDPTVGNESTNRFRSEASIESRESLSFNIAARVVDIRPNGNLVLEARKTYRVNDNLWETSLSGICRAKDIAADNVVLSRDMIDLQINKEDQGHLRDGYRRGWFSRWLDRVQPF